VEKGEIDGRELGKEEGRLVKTELEAGVLQTTVVDFQWTISHSSGTPTNWMEAFGRRPLPWIVTSWPPAMLPTSGVIEYIDCAKNKTLSVVVSAYPYPAIETRGT
jgi:hypothetical protein